MHEEVLNKQKLASEKEKAKIVGVSRKDVEGNTEEDFSLSPASHER